LTKRIWSIDAGNVEKALDELDDFLYDYDYSSVNYGQSKDQNCKLALTIEAPLAVLRFLKQHSSSAGIQAIDCELLTSLAMQGSVNQTALLLKIGTIDRANSAMDHFDEAPDIVSAACSFIGYLIGNLITDDLVNDVVAAGGSAMKKHTHDVLVQGRGCTTLRRFVDLVDDGGADDGVAMQVVDALGIDLVIAVMKNHVNDADVLTEGGLFLAKLAELNRRIIDANGLVALAEAVRMYKYKDDPNGIFVASTAMTLVEIIPSCVSSMNSRLCSSRCPC
jgi:hypothetical protein